MHTRVMSSLHLGLNLGKEGRVKSKGTGQLRHKERRGNALTAVVLTSFWGDCNRAHVHPRLDTLFSTSLKNALFPKIFSPCLEDTR